jgi:ABC-type multidrug transport system ATPase subunit
MRQKVALIRATLHRPRVLLLDEPTSSMDPAGARLTWDYILELKRSGLAVVVCTHNLRETARVADRLAIMARGRILAQGTLTELQRDLNLEPRYVQTLVPGLEDVYMEVMTRAGLTPASLLSAHEAGSDPTAHASPDAGTASDPEARA